ncbi:6911_t:CDS:1 [Funneliformis geosporum]|uniref:3754_t:CDS:1 n=1 Tax=Funneliformis geosporum TaxID=1117311 RepID=A0A9W4WWN9_9GLOM|nr:6911_t:CDS:1 [Funneliformis geosporum]CAI2177780.1 3754_t:CDS:1 [Funneliformis geosporum]
MSDHYRKPSKEVRKKLDEFLRNIDLIKVSLLPDDKRLVAAKSRNGMNVRVKLNGKKLLRRNVTSEIEGKDIYKCNYLIHLAVEEIWHIHLSNAQKEKFTTLADEANEINRIYNLRPHINNSSTIDRISVISRQDTDNPAQKDFYNGSNFNESSVTVSSIFSPAGTFPGSSFSQ